MRILLTLAGVVAAVAAVAPAQADPGNVVSGPDAAFLAELDKAGVAYRNGPDAVAVAKRACQMMDQGSSEVDVINDVSASNPGFSTSDARKFVGVAVSDYCPQHAGEPNTPPSAAPPAIWPEFPWPAPPAA